MEVLGPGECSQAEVADGLLHRVEGRSLARQDRELQKLVKLLRELCGAGHLESPVRGHQSSHPHAVQRQRPGLVDAKNRGGPEGFDRGDAAREDPLAGDSPGAQGQEDRENDGEFLGEHGHRDRQAGEQALEQAPPGARVEQDDQGTDGEADHGESADDAGDLALERALLRHDRLEGFPDPAHLGGRPGCADLCEALPGDDERARENPRCRIPCRTLLPHRALVHGDRLARQKRLVDRKVRQPPDVAVGGDTISLGGDEQVAPHDLAPRDSFLLRITDDLRTGTGEVPELLERPLGPAALK